MRKEEWNVEKIDDNEQKKKNSQYKQNDAGGVCMWLMFEHSHSYMSRHTQNIIYLKYWYITFFTQTMNINIFHGTCHVNS